MQTTLGGLCETTVQRSVVVTATSRNKLGTGYKAQNKENDMYKLHGENI